MQGSASWCVRLRVGGDQRPKTIFLYGRYGARNAPQSTTYGPTLSIYESYIPLTITYKLYTNAGHAVSKYFEIGPFCTHAAKSHFGPSRSHLRRCHAISCTLSFTVAHVCMDHAKDQVQIAQGGRERCPQEQPTRPSSSVLIFGLHQAVGLAQ